MTDRLIMGHTFWLFLPDEEMQVSKQRLPTELHYCLLMNAPFLLKRLPPGTLGGLFTGRRTGMSSWGPT